MKIAYLQRKLGIGYSIERLFDDIRSALPDKIKWEVWYAKKHSLYPHWIVKNIHDAQKIEADIFHTTGDSYYLALAHRAETSILTIHDCVALNRLKGWRKTYFYKSWYQWPIRHANIVTTISRASADELMKKVPEVRKKLVVIPDCVSDKFQFSKINIDNKAFTILQVGTQANKNIERLIAALAGTPCHLRIIGPLSVNQQLFLKKSGVNVVSMQNLSEEDILKEYQQCDAVSFISTYEGFGLPILEAQAVGRPVITSDIAPMNEVAGDGALKVDPYDIPAIRAAVMRLCADSVLQKELICRGLHNVKKFRPSVIVQGYSQIYNGIQIER